MTTQESDNSITREPKNPRTIRVRFAPSPTGDLHLGGARTALFNWLFARKHHGTFILRIEDTDEVRSTKESVQAIFDGLQWLGLDWDEGPVTTENTEISQIMQKGEFGPYFQAQRYNQGIYQKYIQQLLAEGKAYYCYCTTAELELQRQEAMRSKVPPKYDGRCRKLTDAERKKKEAEGRKPAIRFKMPTEGEISFIDLIRGEVRFENNLLDDFVVVKASGIPTYNFACAVDDYLMKITQVLRGDDHISNTPRQLHIFKALTFAMPEYAHFPMIHGSDGARLSKRHGATSVMEYKDMGYLPAAMANYLALLGWSTEDSQQLFTLSEMIDKFGIERCGKSSAVFDSQKLLWMNGVYIRNLPAEKLMEYTLDQLQKNNLHIDSNNTDMYNYVKKAVTLEQEKIKLLTDIPKLIDFFLKEDIEYRAEAVEKVLRKPNVSSLLEEINQRIEETQDFSAHTLENIVRKYAEEKGLKPGAVFHPIRVAVSGRTEGPGLFEMLELLGKQRVVARIRQTQKYLEGII